MKVKVVVPVLPTQEAKIGMSKERESEGYVMVEEEIEVVEEDYSEEEEDDEPDWMVEHLFDRLKEVKQRVSPIIVRIYYRRELMAVVRIRNA